MGNLAGHRGTNRRRSCDPHRPSINYWYRCADNARTKISKSYSTRLRGSCTRRNPVSFVVRFSDVERSRSYIERSRAKRPGCTAICFRRLRAPTSFLSFHRSYAFAAATRHDNARTRPRVFVTRVLRSLLVQSSSAFRVFRVRLRATMTKQKCTKCRTRVSFNVSRLSGGGAASVEISSFTANEMSRTFITRRLVRRRR